jgi:hypothetical protein
MQIMMKITTIKNVWAKTALKMASILCPAALSVK